MTKAVFKLFRSTSPSNRCEYVGSLVTPEGICYAIEANVVEHDRGDGTKGKHFEGRLFGGQDVVRKMLKGAKVDGKVPDDLLALIENVPFDDPLPEGMGIGSESSPPTSTRAPAPTEAKAT